MPTWLNESFAIHLSGESPLVRLQSLATATISETLLPLAQLGVLASAGLAPPALMHTPPQA